MQQLKDFAKTYLSNTLPLQKEATKFSQIDLWFCSTQACAAHYLRLKQAEIYTSDFDKSLNSLSALYWISQGYQPQASATQNQQIEQALETIKGIDKMRQYFDTPSVKRLDIFVDKIQKQKTQAQSLWLTDYQINLVQKCAACRLFDGVANGLTVKTSSFCLSAAVDMLADIHMQKQKINELLQRLQIESDYLQTKLADQGFLENAKQTDIASKKRRLSQLQTQIDVLLQKLNLLG